MPGYIGFTPQFNPISLQDYLTVPMMVLNEYNKAEEQYNETANKAEALKALLGERNSNNEAGWQIVDKYESLVKDAADAMAATGIQGPEGYRQAKKAGTYYRQNMLPLESGINALQTDEKELRARDKDGTLVRKRRYSLNDYIKNPNLRSDSVLGSSIQNEAMKAAATASARRKQENQPHTALGGQYWQLGSVTGFSPNEVQDWLADRNSSPELNEIYNGIAKKFVDAGYDIRDIDDYITRGIYDGITYDNKIEYKDNKQWALDHTSSGKNGKKTDDNNNPYLQQSLSSPDLGQKAQVKDETVTKLTSNKTFSNNGYSNYVTGQINPKDAPNPYGLVMPSIYNMFGNTTTSNEPYREMGVYEASARHYAKQNDVQKQSTLTDRERRKTIGSLVKKVDLYGNPTTSLGDISEKQLNNVYSYAKAAGFNKYQSFESIPKNVKNQFYRYIKSTGSLLAGYKIDDPNEEIARIAYANLLNETPDVKPQEGLLTKKEFDDLKSKGVKFYNADGTPRTNEEIEWDAWDLLPRQYDRYELTHTRGAGAKYAKSATADYFSEFNSGKKYTTQEGKTITLKSNDTGEGFEGYSRPRYFLSAPLLRKNTGYKQLEVYDGDKKYTVEVPLSSFERSVVNSELKRMRGNMLNNLVTRNLMSDEQAKQIASMPINDFLQYIEMGYMPGVHINDILDLLDDAILTASEENFIPSNSETEGKMYD